jgi:hypothetical protein
MRFRPHYSRLMPLWLIPMLYTVASVTAGLILPRLEHVYFAGYTENISVGSALAFFSSVSSGMMALTGIVFAIAFVLVQFSALAYSPRVVIMFASSSTLFHTLGIFIATFLYSLAALVWTDRGGSGRVLLFSTLPVAVLLIGSMIAFARLVQSLSDLQIYNVLQVIATRGRSVIEIMFPLIADNAKMSREELEAPLDLGPPTQTRTHSGGPCVITRFDLDASTCCLRPRFSRSSFRKRTGSRARSRGTGEPPSSYGEMDRSIKKRSPPVASVRLTLAPRLTSILDAFRTKLCSSFGTLPPSAASMKSLL